MTADNFENLLVPLLERRPFRVFTVELNGGNKFEVDSPLAFALKDGVAVYFAPGGIPVWFDHESVNRIVGATSVDVP